MSIFSKARVKTAIESRTKLNLSHQHITTAEFMQLNVAFARELVPSQSISVDFTTYSRLAPMVCPTFGDVNIHHHAFFVPYRTVMPSWNEFINDTMASGGSHPGSSSVPQKVSYFHSLQLSLVFETSSNNLTIPGTSSDYDWSSKTGSSAPYTTTYYKFTPLGRHALKVLNQLGYVLDTDNTANNDYELNALPLLCFVRTFLDYFYPSQYVGNPDYTDLMELVKFQKGGLAVDVSSYLAKILNLVLYVCWDADYFTAAFDNPTAPHSGLYSNVSISDSSLDYSKTSRVITSSLEGTPVINGSSSTAPTTADTPFNVSDFIVKSLHRLTDYMRRHQLVGSRTLDLFLARFGISLDADKLNQSYLLGNYTTPVQIGAVMSNADTSSASLGDFAGQGYAWNDGGQGHFDFEAKEYGMFLILTSIVPKVGYVQGIDRNILHTSKFDFWTPEFDALGTQAISKAELYCDQQDSSRSSVGLGALKDAVFGFTPRYAEYKTIQDKLTGDFRVKSLSGAGLTSNSWHLFRLFNPSAASQIIHSEAFVLPTYSGFNNATQFSRIFQNISNNADHFYIRHNFNIESSFPGRALFDNYDWDDHNGKEIDIESGGVRVN